MDNVDVNKIAVSTKIPYATKSSFKYFIGYNDDDGIRSLHIKPPQIIGYAKYFDASKKMAFKVIDKKSLKSILKNAEKLAV